MDEELNLDSEVMNAFNMNSAPMKGPPTKVGSVKKSIGDFYNEFVKMVNKEKSQIIVNENININDVIDSKASNASNGLETSTFTVCVRVRPMVGDEESVQDENFNCILKGDTVEEQVDGNSFDHTEQCIVLTPKILTFNGKPKLESNKYDFDHCFGPESTNEQVFSSVGKPLVDRALSGQVGVIFAFGQTGSGKTHTMNGMMDNMVSMIFNQDNSRIIKFSYMEILGSTINDCLDSTEKTVQIGELLDGRVETRNLSQHIVDSAGKLDELIHIAKSKRLTAATERNAESSRSHGVGIIRVGHAGFAENEGPAEGVLYIIDLAGSERASDSKNHEKDRMEETKAINLSMMSLKECIRARTMASMPKSGSTTHVPYRRSKLTLLMKDVFDVSCSRLCSTVVLSHVSPLAKDVAHSKNTIAYASPLRVPAQKGSKRLELDVNDPALWTHEQIKSWILDITDNEINNIDRLLPDNTCGIEFCRIPEPEIYKRIIATFPIENSSRSIELAKIIYSKLWMLICDAKTRKRRPNGTIITIEQEQAEAEAVEQEAKAKQELWASREAHLKSER